MQQPTIGCFKYRKRLNVCRSGFLKLCDRLKAPSGVRTKQTLTYNLPSVNLIFRQKFALIGAKQIILIQREHTNEHFDHRIVVIRWMKTPFSTWFKSDQQPVLSLWHNQCSHLQWTKCNNFGYLCLSTKLNSRKITLCSCLYLFISTNKTFCLLICFLTELFVCVTRKCGVYRCRST